jgi:hypothetical protein
MKNTLVFTCVLLLTSSAIAMQGGKQRDAQIDHACKQVREIEKKACANPTSGGCKDLKPLQDYCKSKHK